MGDAILLQKHNERDKETHFLRCRDNAVAVLGALLSMYPFQQQGEDELRRQVVQAWLERLPLRKDKEVAVKQHFLLAQTVLKHPELIFTIDQNIVKTIQVFGSIVETKLCSKETMPIISQALKQLSTYPFVQNNWPQIVGQLEDIQRTRLENCAKMQLDLK